VDLDGSLVTSDTLLESLLALLRKDPWALLLVPIWLAEGKARFKQRVSERVAPAAVALPYLPELVEYLQNEKRAGRTLVLVTAANEKIANSVAEHLGIFDRVIASNATLNLRGDGKAAALVSQFGERGFDYVGDSRTDFPVWSSSRRALVVGSPTFASRVQKLAPVEKLFTTPAPRMRDWAKALRVHQWVKNTLVFVPLLGAHRAGEIDLVVRNLIAFLAFGFCASGAYVINDLVDLTADRAHARKRARLFASGRLSITSGLAVAPILLAVAFLLALTLPPAFAAILALYFAATTAYSLRVKQIAVLDVLLLAGLYTVRLLAGAAAVSVPVSFWLLAFSMFLFLSLALVKRVSELRDAVSGASAPVPGRGYTGEDLPVLMSLGTASGYAAVVVFAFYINSSTGEQLYRHPKALWLLCPLLLFWISRIWLFTHRGKMHDDPIVFAFQDPVSRWLVVPIAAIVWLAS
jgi:4-hydroxybenzoate polyprenyltransferase